jgi:hypothetical protein
MDAGVLLCMLFARVQDEADAGVVLHHRAKCVCERGGVEEGKPCVAWARASGGASTQARANRVRRRPRARGLWWRCVVFLEGSRRKLAGRMGLGPKGYRFSLNIVCFNHD